MGVYVFDCKKIFLWLEIPAPQNCLNQKLSCNINGNLRLEKRLSLE